MRGAHAITRLGVDVGRLIDGTGTLIEIRGFDVAVEPEVERGGLLPLVASLEHFGRLLEEPRTLEGLSREPAVFRELGVIRRRARDRKASETILEIAPIIFSGTPVVTRLRADLRRFQVVADPLEDGRRFGQSAGMDEQPRRLVVLSVTLMDLGRVTKASVVLENLRRPLPIARSRAGIALACPACAFIFLSQAENFLPTGAALGGTKQKNAPQQRFGRYELGWQDNQTQTNTCKILRRAGVRRCFYYTDGCSDWNTRLTA